MANYCIYAHNLKKGIANFVAKLHTQPRLVPDGGDRAYRHIEREDRRKHRSQGGRDMSI